jgi:hypothetical protein
MKPHFEEEEVLGVRGLAPGQWLSCSGAILGLIARRSRRLTATQPLYLLIFQPVTVNLTTPPGLAIRR